jgi:broad specificity polyphosphatase/5'/3'-nucleotidase SurE
MSELSTVLINDSRYKNITDSVTIGVKDGPASVIHQKYKHNSNSTSSTLFNINVPSENTLIDRNIHVEGTVSCYYEASIAGTESVAFSVVPAAFPMNQALQSATLTLNNSKLSVQTQDVLQVYLKQFHQTF